MDKNTFNFVEIYIKIINLKHEIIFFVVVFVK